MEPLLEIRDLSVVFHTPEGVVRAVERVNLTIAQGETLGLVGESGCGKSVTAMSILRLLPSPPAHIESGQIIFNGRDLLSIPEDEIRRIRGRDIGMVFQEPMTSLNPVLTIGRQMTEPFRVHERLPKVHALKRAIQWLERVRIPEAPRRLRSYPHHLSGGMRQRVMIAMALCCRPKLLIADEPTTALDVTIQAQVLTTIKALKEEMGMAVLLITHDMGVVAQMASRVVVMYAGEVVEAAEVSELFDSPFHPYTQGLLRCLPQGMEGASRLHEIPGSLPSALQEISGCKFQERCAHSFELCSAERPDLFSVREGHMARCWLFHYPEKRREDG
jgi:oligopeptide/dipeptide ABC transporter ATP-binding protein